MSSPVVHGYVFTDKLGSGSYAAVYKAHKKDKTREVVAIKCVERTSLSRGAFENIVSEITLLRVLKHEHVVEMKNFKFDERFIYIIMEFCDGGDLSCFIRKRRKLPEAVCQKFLQQLALALKFLRSHNVCHMDLKPENLLLTTKPKLCLKLGDFGFAQYLSTEDQNTALRGSPLYMAPEMLMKQKYDARVDLWSVGIIMYECLFGTAPYSSKTFDELVKKILEQSPIQIPHGHVISPKCADLLMKLLQHDPDKRIDYDAFFEHPFLDLEHYPSSESYEKAVRLVCDAVKCDTEKNFTQAFSLYCEALKYFVPLVNAESYLQRKTAMCTKVYSYVKRAEALKKLCVQTENTSAHSSNLIELGVLCSPSPTLAAALEIGNAGEQYMAEQQYRVAFEKFESALGILLPALRHEPKGHRRDLLYSQIQGWLKEAETSKAFISAADFSESTSVETRDWCKMQ